MAAHKICELSNTELLLLHNALSAYIEDEKADVPQQTTTHRKHLLNKLAQMFSSSPTTFEVSQKKESQ